ncbi:MAG: AAA family ATPase [Bacillota bacterium]
MSYHLDLVGNITTYLVLAGLSPRKARRRTEEALERFGLREHRRKKPHEVSGGLRRRAELARVLARRVPVLFLDEPTAGLDPGARRELWEEVRSLGREGCLVFLTTHSFEEAGAVADVVGIMRLNSGEAFRWYGGRLRTEEELRRKYLVEKPRTGTHCFIIEYGGRPIGYLQSGISEPLRPTPGKSST